MPTFDFRKTTFHYFFIYRLLPKPPCVIMMHESREEASQRLQSWADQANDALKKMPEQTRHAGSVALITLDDVDVFPSDEGKGMQRSQQYALASQRADKIQQRWLALAAASSLSSTSSPSSVETQLCVMKTWDEKMWELFKFRVCYLEYMKIEVGARCSAETFAYVAIILLSVLF
jgi:hypothetical protein